MRVCGTGLGGGVGVGVAYMGTCVVVGGAVGGVAEGLPGWG